MAQQKKKWSELSGGARAAIIVGGLIELVLTMTALKDLRRRDRSDVRGPKWLWALLSAVQPVGPIAYLVLGRKSRD